MFKFYKNNKGTFLIASNTPGIPFQEFMHDRNHKSLPKKININQI
jgi:hypothetical protein